jgi:2-oxoglutarate/2-oxoacid ferredoxin oxidoreductase subunit beta
MSAIETRAPSQADAVHIGRAAPPLLQSEHHGLCPGCGHPVGVRTVLEVLDELKLVDRTICVAGHGCYSIFSATMDIETIVTLHGRAPATATGVKRMSPDSIVWTLQGDGDMVSEGLAEIMHTAARGERLTCILLNNGVFGDTGGQMTAMTVVGQRTKNTLQGREPNNHGFPIPIADIIARFPGASYVARGSVHSASEVNRSKQLVRAAFRHQIAGAGFTFVELLTMCPTGWFVPAPEGPDYLNDSMKAVYPLGVLKDSDIARDRTHVS